MRGLPYRMPDVAVVLNYLPRYLQLKLAIRILVIRINWFGRIFFLAAKILLAI